MEISSRRKSTGINSVSNTRRWCFVQSLHRGNDDYDSTLRHCLSCFGSVTLHEVTLPDHNRVWCSQRKIDGSSTVKQRSLTAVRGQTKVCYSSGAVRQSSLMTVVRSNKFNYLTTVGGSTVPYGNCAVKGL